jgi:hypothetical protein
LLLGVFVLVACFLAVVVDELTCLAVLALALEFLGGLVLAGLEFAAYLLFGTLELLAR